MATNLQLPNQVQQPQVGLGNLYNQMVMPQQPDMVGGLNRQGLSDMFLAIANSAGVDPRTGMVNWGIGAGATAYSNRVAADEAKQEAYQLQLAKDKQALIQELKKKYTPESIQEFVSQGMSDYSLLKELPKDFAVRKQTGSFEDGKFVEGTGDTYNVKYDQYGNVVSAAQAEPDKATTKEFYNEATQQSELWRVDPTTGRKLENLGVTGMSPDYMGSRNLTKTTAIRNMDTGEAQKFGEPKPAKGYQTWNVLADPRTGAVSTWQSPIEAKKDTAAGGSEGAATPEAIAQTQNAINQIDYVLGRKGDLGGITGALGKRTGWATTAKGMDLLNSIKTVKDILTLDNMGVMKGVLTDRDMAIISQAASGINMPTDESGEASYVSMSPEKLISELERIRQLMVERMGRQTATPQQTTSTQPQTQQPATPNDYSTLKGKYGL